MTEKLSSLTVLFTIFLISSATEAAEVFKTDAWSLNNHYYIHGPLENGDFYKLIELARDNGSPPRTITINSPGGSVDEAIMIGRFARKFFVSCIAESQCDSACFLVLAGCAERSALTDIGIHRPSFEPSHFGSLPFSEAKEKYNKLLENIEVYLKEMDVPESVIQNMVSVSSDSLKLMAPAEFESRIGEHSPAYDEWLRAKCGSMSEQEEHDKKALWYAQGYEAYLNGNIPEIDQESLAFIRSKYEWVNSQSMSPGYKDYLENKSQKVALCRGNSAREEANAIWNRIQP